MFTATTTDPFAIRISAANAVKQNGVAGRWDQWAVQFLAGTNYRFTQANWDNVRLECVPEPSSIVFLGSLRLGHAICFPPPGHIAGALSFTGTSIPGRRWNLVDADAIATTRRHRRIRTTY